MAAQLNPSMLFFDASGSVKVAVYRMSNVTSGDTLDVSAQGSLLFFNVLAAVALSAGKGAPVACAISNNTNGQPTVVTMTLSGMANDEVTLMVEGMA